MITKICRLCDSSGPFSKNRRVCKICERIRVDAWAKANRDKCNKNLIKYRTKHPLKVLESRLKNEYKFTKSEIKIILGWNKEPCVICGKSLTKFGMGWDDACVEHNHKTNRFRGITCGRCNRILGMAEDRIDILMLLIQHLRKEKS